MTEGTGRQLRASYNLSRRIVGPRLSVLLADTSTPFPEIVRVLADEHDVHVSTETLRRWAADLGLPPRRPRDPERMAS